jgi:copper(I)-binding protein
MTRVRAAILALLLSLPLLAGGPASAHDYELGSLVIQHPWARASIGQAKAGAAYLTIVNHGETADRLIAVSTPAAKHAKPHTHLLEDGVMKMRPVEAIEIAPGDPAVLQPGGLHIMLMGLAAPLETGKPFPMTLVFENAGSVDVEVHVTDPLNLEGAESEHSGHGS